MPNCSHCHEAIELMKFRNMPFEQIDTGTPEGMKKFREFYTKYKEQIGRKEGKGIIDLPILVYQNNGTFRIHQGSEGLEKFLETK